MATAPSKPPHKRTDAQSGATAAPPEKSRRRRRFRLIFWLPLLLLVGLLAAGPTLASWTPLGCWLAGRFAPVNGSLELGALSIGWFTPPTAQGIVLRDAQGAVVAEVAAATGDKSLASLLLSRTDLGKLEVDSPQLYLVLRADGSNLEDVLAPLLTGGRQGGGAVAVALTVAGGSATVDDQAGKRKYQINDVNTDLEWDGASREPLTLHAAAELVDANRTANIDLALEARDGEAEGDSLGAGHLTCQIDRLPLDAVESLVRRRIAGAQMAGSLSAKLDGSWGGGAGHDEVSVQGQIDASDLLFAADALGRDRIEMTRLSAPCQIVGTSKEVRIEKLQVDCDLGQVALSGKVRLADFAAGNVAEAIAGETCQLTGKLDLVRLAALLPETLRIRPGTQVTAGELSVSLASQAQPAGMGWSGRLETSDLEALADGAPLRWQQPLTVAFQAHLESGGPVVDKLTCESSFLRAEGSGTLDQITAEASFDLSRLGAELAQFVDLGGCQMTGAGEAHCTWQRADNGAMQSHADVTASDFALIAPGRRPWREAALKAHFAATGSVQNNLLERIDTATAQVEAGDEVLSVQLLSAVDKPWTNPLPLQIDWRGALAGLLPRLEVCIDMTGWDLAGQGNLHALVHASPAQLDIDESTLTVDRLHVWGHGLYIDEAHAELAASGRLQPAIGAVEVPLASLKGTSVILRLNNLAISRPQASGLQAAGTATLEGDLAALVRWLADPRVPAARQVAGQLSGQFELAYGSGVAHATLSAAVDRLEMALASTPAARPTTLLRPAVAPAPPAVWQEPRLTLAARLDYDPARDSLQITQGELAGASLQAQVGGKIEALGTVPDLDLTGQLVCDWEQLAPLWRPYVGDAVKIVGREPWPFTVRGPWTPGATPALAAAQKLNAEATVRWLSASAYGLDVSGGTLDARLADGTLTIQPVDVAVSGGRVQLAPVIRLAAQPAEIELPAGPLLTNVQLSQQVCAQGLKYIAPVFAEVTRTEGQFSVALAGGRIPLADPEAGDLTGSLEIQSVNMRPGPILQTLVGFAEQVEGILQGKVPFAHKAQAVALVRMENQKVDFRLVDRRIYHRGLQFVAGNVTITTRGSVGLDESLAVLAEIPLTPNLIGSHPNAANLNRQTLQIPIGGTLKNPQIDPRAIEQLPLLLIKGTGQVLNRLEGTLEKLVPGQR